jgi:predicted dehydrogenase
LVHVGLIGAGNISDTHARALRAIDGVGISAIYSPTRAHAEQLAAAHGAAACGTLDDLFDHRPLDAVIVGSPSGLHAEQGIAAARRGLHVLIEKPIDVSTARADTLIDEASRAGITLGVIFQDRLKPDVRRMKGLVDAGRLGAPILASARVRWYRPPAYYEGSRWRGTRALDGGGALMNQGVHTVDLLLWLFGPVRRVTAATATRLHAIEVEDTAVAALEFASGALGTLEAATSAFPGYSRRLELTGDNGTLILDGDDLVGIDLRDPRDRERPSRTAAPTVSAASPVVADASAHARVIADFLRAVATRTPPCCDGPGGRQSVALIEAVYESARTRRPVDIT